MLMGIRVLYVVAQLLVLGLYLYTRSVVTKKNGEYEQEGGHVLRAQKEDEQMRGRLGGRRHGTRPVAIWGRRGTQDGANVLPTIWLK